MCPAGLGNARPNSLASLQNVERKMSPRSRHTLRWRPRAGRKPARARRSPRLWPRRRSASRRPDRHLKSTTGASPPDTRNAHAFADALLVLAPRCPLSEGLHPTLPHLWRMPLLRRGAAPQKRVKKRPGRSWAGPRAAPRPRRTFRATRRARGHARGEVCARCDEGTRPPSARAATIAPARIRERARTCAPAGDLRALSHISTPFTRFSFALSLTREASLRNALSLPLEREELHAAAPCADDGLADAAVAALAGGPGVHHALQQLAGVVGLILVLRDRCVVVCGGAEDGLTRGTNSEIHV